MAVKRFERVNSIDCLRNPFTTEFSTMVGCLRHKNLVQLQGWLMIIDRYLLLGELVLVAGHPVGVAIQVAISSSYQRV